MTDARSDAPSDARSDVRSGDTTARRPDAQPPAPLDRASLERVLARAAELQAGQAEPAEQMSEAQLIEVGKEVGISPEHVRLALAEERTRVQLPEARGVVGGLFGGEEVTASRVVSGSATDILGRLDDWMQKEESLRPKRRFADRLTWEARRDFLGTVQQGLNFSGRAYALTSTDEVGATVVPVDAQRCIVRLDASLAGARRRHVIGGSLAVGGGVLGLAGLVTLSALLPGGSVAFGVLVGLAPAVGGGAAAYAVAAAQRRRVARAQLALEQILDRLERGEIRKPANPLADFIDQVARKVEQIR